MPLPKVPATVPSDLKSIDISSLPCQEASPLSYVSYIPCGRSSASLIWHSKDGRVYPMCPACADHNMMNRGGKQVRS